MMNQNVIPFIDAECEDMKKNDNTRFLNIIKENIR